MSKPTLLLTGAAGVLGRVFIEELAADHHLIGIRHRQPIDDPRVEEIQGSLADPGLGLDTDDYRRLARRVDIVLHSAACTSWRASRADLFATNATGTGHMLGFAEAAKAPFYYVSTAFVARPEPEQAAEKGPSAYVDSKIAAERLVRDSGVSAAIVRPSVVGGDSRTGQMAAFQGMHQVVAGTVMGTIPVIPAAPESPFDHIPQDVVARGVGKLLRAGVTTGEYWLTGGPNTPALGEYIDRILEVAARHGHTPAPPRLIAAEAVDRLLLPLMDDLLTPTLRSRFTGMLQLLQLFQSSSLMESSFDALGMSDDIAPDRLLDAFDKTVEYWIATKMRRPVGAAA
ncbi:SDR family oxidoreductase [Streptomyces sp. NBC_01007]|nr:SDR family oxidoreductase [Streptomyces sp. NBC_01007]WRZ95719.1 SDR family oxidoreductase [Streptomyces sp. NBC_01007]